MDCKSIFVVFMTQFLLGWQVGKRRCQLKYGQGESNFKQYYAKVYHLCASYTYTTYNTIILYFKLNPGDLQVH